MTKTPITVVSGYLGSGKTTFILNCLKNRVHERMGLIINDVSEKNVDADTIARSPYFTEKDKLIPLSKGSISSNLLPDLEKALIELAYSDSVDYIFVEGSGIATPQSIAQLIMQGQDEKGKQLSETLRIDSMITIADAQRLAQQFDPEIGKYNDAFLDSNQLIIRQIEFCDILLFNKLDLVAEKEKQYVTHLLRTLQPNARFIETTFSQVSPETVIDTYLFDPDKPLLEADDTEDLSDRKDLEAGGWGIESFVYRRRRPFHPERFDAWLDRWPKQISRCKGVMWLITQPNDVFKLSQSGRAMDIIPSGYWIASLKQWEIDKLFDIRPHLHDIWHERFGDRMIELVFIGKDMDKQHIIDTLDQCLYMDNELIPYQTDPFKYR